jgi:hypothetical protein
MSGIATGGMNGWCVGLLRSIVAAIGGKAGVIGAGRALSVWEQWRQGGYGGPPTPLIRPSQGVPKGIIWGECPNLMGEIPFTPLWERRLGHSPFGRCFEKTSSIRYSSWLTKPALLRTTASTAVSGMTIGRHEFYWVAWPGASPMLSSSNITATRPKWFQV